jgi:hypothetical protein
MKKISPNPPETPNLSASNSLDPLQFSEFAQRELSLNRAPAHLTTPDLTASQVQPTPHY